MASVDGECTQNIYSGLELDEEGNKKFAIKVITDFLKHVIYSLPELPYTAQVSNDLQCSVCGKNYKRPTALKKHEEDQHGIREPVNQVSN